MTNNTQRSVEEKLRQENKTMTWQIGEWKKEEDMWLDREKSLMKENEALKARVEGLVDILIRNASEYTDRHGHLCDNRVRLEAVVNRCNHALSILPSTFLEIQKAKDAVIEASEQIKDLHVGQKFLKLQEALRTLQQAQEKK